MAILNVRDKITKQTYASFVKPICFRHDAEKVHNLFVAVGKYLGAHKITKKATKILFNYQHPILEQSLQGILFRNPIGLSAGFDKNAELISIMEDIGFGFVEVGSITAQPCTGNKGIRLRRIPEQQSIWVNLGLNNKGSKAIAAALYKKKYSIPVGISIARTNCPDTIDPEKALEDQERAIRDVRNISDYITLNISCPNAYGGQPFSNPDLYRKLLQRVKKMRLNKPVFVKISPDLSNETIDQILTISEKSKIAGFICTNLTKQGSKKSGGYSGKLVEQKSNELLAYIYRKTKGSYILIGSGGISSAADAYKKIKLGANLIQLITGMIYHGPGLISEINRGLVQLLKKDGYNSLSEAVGKAS